MTHIHNPIIWADVPDVDVIRVENTFYMVSTSMHSMPGCPVMRSYDLKHWEIVSYVFDRLEEADGNNLENGSNIYGKGSWAASLRYVNGYFYCLFNSNDAGHAYIFRTRDAESSNWERFSLKASLHDPAMLVDGEKCYILYSNGDIRLVEMTEDMLDIKPETDRLFFESQREGMGLRAEGGHAYRIGDWYYGIYIEWPREGNCRRRVVAYRWRSFEGPVEHRVVLDDDMGYHNAGVAQGGLIDLPDNKGWVAMLFQDHGAVGRIPCLVPVTFEDDWPVMGVNGKVPEDFDIDLEEIPCPDAQGQDDARSKKDKICLTENYMLSGSDDLNHDLNILSPKWQWNHNPDDSLWSFKKHKGCLRLENGHLTDGILQARNTLTQRTYGPGCVAKVHLDTEGMKDGDRAGLVALQGLFGLIGVRCSALPDGSREKKMTKYLLQEFFSFLFE
ncbi:MAG: glycoside hydrolase 43 family protein [Lachnospiraceae bacterium]|nr:glycoside hydrolase 43 family protein [Lachnospiraceae bacterium]